MSKNYARVIHWFRRDLRLTHAVYRLPDYRGSRIPGILKILGQDLLLMTGVGLMLAYVAGA